jgi:carbonic anhydrase
LGVTKSFVILTCMDSRVLPDQIFGLEVGDAEVIRNAGGRVTADVLRSLVVCQDLLACDAVVVLHHTDCGAQEAARRHQELQSKLWGHFMRGPTVGWFVRGMSYLAYYASAVLPHFIRRKAFDAVVQPIYDLPTSLREDVQALRRSAVVSPSTQLYGLLYKVEDGSVEVVVRDRGTGVEKKGVEGWVGGQETKDEAQ